MGALTLLVTGAGGFLGHAVAESARARGHRVRTLTRRPGGDVVCDLVEDLPPAATEGIDRILHCAAALTGDAAVMQRDTVQATLNVAAAGLPLVLAGSIAVYDGMAAAVDESTPLEPHPELRDAYTRAKIAQERAAAGSALRILRIGALWGPGQLWNAHLGPRTGPVLWRIGRGEIPLAHVRNAALAMVIAAEGTWSGTEVFNVVDDARPDARGWLAAMKDGGFHPPFAIPLPFAALDLTARALSPFARSLPGLLRRPTLHARIAPHRYANARLHALGWAPAVSLAEGMAP